MKTAAIIVNHNNNDDLVKIINRIKEYEIFDAVVIVDNKSDDVDEVEKIADKVIDNSTDSDGNSDCDSNKNHSDDVNADGGCNTNKNHSADIDRNHKIILIRADRNGGYGYGNNIGMKWAFENGFTHAVVANPDTEFSEDCVKALLTEFAHVNDDATSGEEKCKCNNHTVSGEEKCKCTNAQVAVVAPICKTPESNYEAPQSGWKLKTWGQELLSKGPVSRRVFRNFVNGESSGYHTLDLSLKKIDVDAVLGSVLAVDVAKFNEVGGYDDDIFLYCEENILGQKMKGRGYTTRLLIDQEYLHNHKPGLPGRQAIKNLAASELYYFEKYLCASPLQMMISKIFFWFVYMETCIAGG